MGSDDDNSYKTNEFQTDLSYIDCDTNSQNLDSARMMVTSKCFFFQCSHNYEKFEDRRKGFAYVTSFSKSTYFKTKIIHKLTSLSRLFLYDVKRERTFRKFCHTDKFTQRTSSNNNSKIIKLNKFVKETLNERSSALI